MRENLWLTVLTCLAYCADKELWKVIDYLKEQVRVLKEQQEKDKRIPLNDQQRLRLARAAAWTAEILPPQSGVTLCRHTARVEVVRAEVLPGASDKPNRRSFSTTAPCSHCPIFHPDFKANRL
jgi:hypothetical protein